MIEFLYLVLVLGKSPVRVFFNANYKPVNPDGQDTSRQVNKDEVPTLQQDLQFIERQIKEITIEVEHAKRQEAYLNQANGNLSLFQLDEMKLIMTFFRINSKSFRMVQLFIDCCSSWNCHLANLVFEIVFFCQEATLTKRGYASLLVAIPNGPQFVLVMLSNKC